MTLQLIEDDTHDHAKLSPHQRGGGFSGISLDIASRGVLRYKDCSPIQRLLTRTLKPAARYLRCSPVTNSGGCHRYRVRLQYHLDDSCYFSVFAKAEGNLWTPNHICLDRGKHWVLWGANVSVSARLCMMPQDCTDGEMQGADSGNRRVTCTRQIQALS